MDDTDANRGREPNKEDFSALRSEIVESQKARIDLLKYKLIAVAALASVGLGFSGPDGTNSISNPVYVLLVVPFVCLYVDSLCYHNNIRILIVHHFLCNYGDLYETYLVSLGKYMPSKGLRWLFGLEEFALTYSTLLASTSVMIFGFSRPFSHNHLILLAVATIIMIVVVLLWKEYLYKYYKSSVRVIAFLVAGVVVGLTSVWLGMIWVKSVPPKAGCIFMGFGFLGLLGSLLLEISSRCRVDLLKAAAGRLMQKR